MSIEVLNVDLTSVDVLRIVIASVGSSLAADTGLDYCHKHSRTPAHDLKGTLWAFGLYLMSILVALNPFDGPTQTTGLIVAVALIVAGIIIEPVLNTKPPTISQPTRRPLSGIPTPQPNTGDPNQHNPRNTAVPAD